jgi:mannose-6-phosphate isomerase
LPFGESWEISARKEADSAVVSGSLRGKTLTQLWENSETRSDIFGPLAPNEEQFPLLCKILDARDKLSIQVHPPASVAERLGGEPKTEVWYVADAEPGACLYVGLRDGIAVEELRAAIEEGTAEVCVHAIPVKTGEHIFIPSGRLHAIGAGLLIYEIQQNSDTTYRVYDWNRPGLDGTMRQLHVKESMQCIDFEDVEPEMDEPDGVLLTNCKHFRLERHVVDPGNSVDQQLKGRFAIGTVVRGSMISGEDTLVEGDFFIAPYGADSKKLSAGEFGAEWLLTTWPEY